MIISGGEKGFISVNCGVLFINYMIMCGILFIRTDERRE